jgi:outer membrane cobalamin receptor
VAFTVNVVGSALDRDFSQQGSPRVTLPGYTTIGLSGSYAVFSNVWHMKSLRLQMKIDNLLGADYEQVLGFSRAGIRVRGGVTVNF